MTKIRENIKIILLKENLTLVELAKKLSKKLNKKTTADSLSQKLRKGTIKYEEINDILDCLGYDIDFKKRL